MAASWQPSTGSAFLCGGGNARSCRLARIATSSSPKRQKIQYAPSHTSVCVPIQASAGTATLRLGGLDNSFPGPDFGGRQNLSELTADFIEFPSRSEFNLPRKDDPPLVRVRLSVHYRVHSRQILCVGGSQIPFGWSFLSIAKVPMEWTPDDVWTVEVELPAGSKLEYKYVILEEQDWTKLTSEDAEGVVTFTYRTKPDDPLDIQTIQKQMAIVAWQPGPNRLLQVPSPEEFSTLQPGQERERAVKSQVQQQMLPFQRRFSQQSSNAQFSGYSPNYQPASQPDADNGETFELLTLDGDGVPLLKRRDVWGFSDKRRPPNSKGLSFGP